MYSSLVRGAGGMVGGRVADVCVCGSSDVLDVRGRRWEVCGVARYDVRGEWPLRGRGGESGGGVEVVACCAEHE